MAGFCKNCGAQVADDFKFCINCGTSTANRPGIVATQAYVAPPAQPVSTSQSVEGGGIFYWMLLPLRRYADFDGRSRRKEYWLFMLYCLPIFMILAIVEKVLDGAVSLDTTSAFVVGGIGLITLVISIPHFAVAVRRFHDQDMSGWFVLLSFIPLLGLIVLIFMCAEGTRGPNRFGPDPKGEAGSATFTVTHNGLFAALAALSPLAIAIFVVPIVYQLNSRSGDAAGVVGTQVAAPDYAAANLAAPAQPYSDPNVNTVGGNVIQGGGGITANNAPIAPTADAVANEFVSLSKPVDLGFSIGGDGEGEPNYPGIIDVGMDGCGKVALINVTEIPVFSRDSNLITSDGIEINNKGKVLRRWRLPNSYVIQFLDGDWALAAYASKDYSLWFHISGKLAQPSPAEAELATGDHSGAMMVATCPGQRNNQCVSVRDRRTRTRRIIVNTGVCS